MVMKICGGGGGGEVVIVILVGDAGGRKKVVKCNAFIIILCLLPQVFPSPLTNFFLTYSSWLSSSWIFISLSLISFLLILLPSFLSPLAYFHLFPHLSLVSRFLSSYSLSSFIIIFLPLVSSLSLPFASHVHFHSILIYISLGKKISGSLIYILA